MNPKISKLKAERAKNDGKIAMLQSRNREIDEDIICLLYTSICVAIYAVLVQNMIVDTNISTAIWSCMGYTVLLCFTLFKTGSLAKSLFNSH